MSRLTRLAKILEIIEELYMLDNITESQFDRIRDYVRKEIQDNLYQPNRNLQ
jgi:hypothetical protein